MTKISEYGNAGALLTTDLVDLSQDQGGSVYATRKTTLGTLATFLASNLIAGNNQIHYNNASGVLSTDVNLKFTDATNTFEVNSAANTVVSGSNYTIFNATGASLTASTGSSIFASNSAVLLNSVNCFLASNASGMSINASQYAYSIGNSVSLSIAGANYSGVLSSNACSMGGGGGFLTHSMILTSVSCDIDNTSGTEARNTIIGSSSSSITGLSSTTLIGTNALNVTSGEGTYIGNLFYVPQGAGIRIGTSGSGYSFPTTAGSLDQVLGINGSGDLDFRTIVSSNIYTADGTLTSDRVITMGVESLTIDSNYFFGDTHSIYPSRYGIGTNAPAARLTVRGTDNTSGNSTLLVTNFAGTKGIEVHNDGAVTIGTRSGVQAGQSYTMGVNCEAGDGSAICIGRDSTVEGNFSIGIGNENNINGTASTARDGYVLGDTNTISTTQHSLALGFGNVISGGTAYTLALGQSVLATGAAISVGRYLDSTGGSFNMTLGTGALVGSRLLNASNQDMYFGMNSTIPTMIITNGGGVGGLGTVNLKGDAILDSPNVPATAASSGTAGTIAWDSSFIYVCTAASTWKRAAIATW
jgi:hypothetical protein